MSWKCRWSQIARVAMAAVVAQAAIAAQIPTTAQFTTDDAAVERVLDLADQRLAIMPAVAAVKWQTHVPIFDPARENAVIQRAQDLGVPMGLASDPLKNLFELQARLARDVQSGLHAEWQAHGFSYSEPMTTLGALRPQLDALTVDLLQAIYIAEPVLQREGFEARYSKLAAQRLHSSGWSEQNRRDLLDSLHALQQTQAPALQRITASGVLRVGTTGDYAPFSLEANGTLSGSDIEMAGRLAEHLHARAVFIRTTWASMLGDLAQGAFDLSMGGVSVTPERQSQGSFSIFYMSGGKTLIARCSDSPKFRDGLAAVDQRKVRVIVNPGGTNEQFVRANIHHARIVAFPDNRGVFNEISAGRADVMITDDIEAELQAHRHPDLCRAYPGTFTQSGKAILMPRGSELVGAVNLWLSAAISAGEPARLLNDFLR